ncbi:MAG: hypothetical protein V1799_05000 [bacterium]
MNRLISIALIVCLSEFVHSQVHSINIYSSYTAELSKRLKVTDASAVGGGVELRMNLTGRFYLSVIGGYDLFSIQQDSALERWNWRFWNERYKGIVKDNLNSDTSLSASLSPVQKMDGLSLMLRLSTDLQPAANVTVTLFVGGGVMFYTRRMYLIEEWQKRFSAIDYTFEYSYRNFAQNKLGNPIILNGGFGAEYQFSEIVTLNGAVQYHHVLATPGKLNYDEFPLSSMLSFHVGLRFLY